MYIRAPTRSLGNYPWYGVRHPVRAVVPAWYQCLPMVNNTYRPWFYGFNYWHTAMVWVYLDWALLAVLVGYVLGQLH